MITIKTDHNTAFVYAESMDSGSEELIRALCAGPISKDCAIRIMPDVHAGKGCTVGTTMTIRDCVAPGLVGVDIGCGMTVLKIRAKRLELQKLDKVIREKIPAGSAARSLPQRFADQAKLEQLRCARHINYCKALCSIASLGGGNHFIELDRSEGGAYWLIIHSGSRHLGVEVAGYYQKLAYEQTSRNVPYEFAYAPAT